MAAATWLCALPVVTARVARAYPVSSDDATGVLEAVSVLRGNILLSGWSLSSASFAFTDLPFYVAGVALLGQSPGLLRSVPAVIYSVVVVFAVLLARGSRSTGSRPALGAAAALVILGLPALGLAEFMTKGYVRVGTTLGLFAALLALDVPPGRRVSACRIAVFGSILTMTFLSDPYAAYIGAPALMAVCVLGAAGPKTYDNVRLGWVAGAVLLALALGQGATTLIERAGGYRMSTHAPGDYLPKHAVLPQVIHSTSALLAYLPDLYRCGPPTPVTARALALWMGSMIGPALLVWALICGCPLTIRRRVSRPPRPADFVSDALWILIVLAMVGYLTSGTTKDRATMRYMIPFVLSGAVLTGRVLVVRARNGWIPIMALGVLAVAHAVTVNDDLRKPTPPDPAETLARWLHAHGLRSGYAPYWSASIVTASSRGLVSVRPVWVRAVSSEAHSIEPFRFMADDHWYTEEPANFVVYEPRPNAPDQFGIDGDKCVLAFGPAQARFDPGQYEVLIWDHDLRPLLNQISRPDPRVER
jgi:hypothetical protein